MTSMQTTDTRQGIMHEDSEKSVAGRPRPGRERDLRRAREDSPDGAPPELIPRVLGELSGTEQGPLLICVGSLHGNEPAGIRALGRVFAQLQQDPGALRGRLVGLTGNRQALSAGQRFLTSDLNRIWTCERIESVRRQEAPLTDEDLELAELSRHIDREMEQCSQETFVLDLHSTSGEGPAFATLDDTLRNRRFAFELPVPRVLGLEDELAGTLVGHMVDRGITGIGFECGQHDDPTSVDRAEAAIWIAMQACGLLPSAERAEVAEARSLLEAHGRGLPAVVEVRHRHEVESGDGFRMAPGLRSFEPIGCDQHLGDYPSGPVRSPLAGLLLMPLYQRQGDDAFFIVLPVRKIWLALSAVLRRLRLGRCLHWLPGLRRHPELADAYLVDRRRARWLARQLFHLLGFRRASKSETHMVMVPRDPH